ncbi:MAG TPA: ScpA family protein [Trichormus sp.]
MPDDDNSLNQSQVEPERRLPAGTNRSRQDGGAPDKDESGRGNPFDDADIGSAKRTTSALSTGSWTAPDAIVETSEQPGTIPSAQMQEPIDPIGPLAGAPDAIQKAQPADGIEILVKLAENGEIDPKNVDIIDVTDKFLKAIAAAPKENLRQSGKILFHACVLLRMKAEALLADVDLNAGDDFLDFDEESGSIIYDSQKQAVGRQITLQDLERALVRKANTRQNRQRRVTLDQLIEALREAEKIEKIRAERQPRAPRIELAGQHEVNDVNDILDLAHDEDIESTIDHVEMILKNFLEDGEAMQLFHIIRLLDRRGDWVDAFLAVLFLSNAGKITLEQETFYGPLYIRGSEGVEQAGQAAC